MWGSQPEQRMGMDNICSCVFLCLLLVLVSAGGSRIGSSFLFDWQSMIAT